MQARANEAKVKAYSEAAPAPAPVELGDGWSSESEEELIEIPAIQEIVDNESLQEALRRKRLEYVRRCRTYLCTNQPVSRVHPIDSSL
jgi:hypothetical protein